MSERYEELTDKQLIEELREVDHTDQFLSLPVIAEALARLLEQKLHPVPPEQYRPAVYQASYTLLPYPTPAVQ